jgi:hypothetical protein
MSGKKRSRLPLADVTSTANMNGAIELKAKPKAMMKEPDKDVEKDERKDDTEGDTCLADDFDLALNEEGDSESPQSVTLSSNFFKYGPDNFLFSSPPPAIEEKFVNLCLNVFVLNKDHPRNSHTFGFTRCLSNVPIDFDYNVLFCSVSRMIAPGLLESLAGDFSIVFDEPQPNWFIPTDKIPKGKDGAISYIKISRQKAQKLIAVCDDVIENRDLYSHLTVGRIRRIKDDITNEYVNADMLNVNYIGETGQGINDTTSELIRFEHNYPLTMSLFGVTHSGPVAVCLGGNKTDALMLEVIVSGLVQVVSGFSSYSRGMLNTNIVPTGHFMPFNSSSAVDVDGFLKVFSNEYATTRIQDVPSIPQRILDMRDAYAEDMAHYLGKPIEYIMNELLLKEFHRFYGYFMGTRCFRDNFGLWGPKYKRHLIASEGVELVEFFKSKGKSISLDELLENLSNNEYLSNNEREADCSISSLNQEGGRKADCSISALNQEGGREADCSISALNQEGGQEAKGYSDNHALTWMLGMLDMYLLA